jgi:hypothetical protein
MASGIGHDPDCWACGDPAHVLSCEFCGCPTSAVGAVYSHAFDVPEDI